MRISLWIIFLSFTGVFLSCKNKEHTSPKQNQVSYFNNNDTTVINKGVHMDWKEAPNDAVKIKKADLREGQLLLTISYGGGCQNHEFGINANSAIMKSLPPKRSIQLTHNSNEDQCKAYLTKKIQFDVTALLPQGSDSVILILEGYPKPLTLK